MTDNKQPSSADIRASAAEAHYRRLFENAPIAIYALDSGGRFTEINPAGERLLGLDADALIGRHLSEVIAPDDLGAVLDLNARMRSGEFEVAEFEAHVVRPDGELRLLHIRSSPIMQGGKVVGSHGVGDDVTEKRAREKFLQRSERLATVGSLISGMAHELNNPLNAIRNFAQLMLLDERSDDDREALEIMRAEADRAAGIVADLRGVTRQTQMEGEMEPVDLNTLVRHVLTLREYALGTKNINVVERLSPDLPHVLANRTDLEQALLNLIMNAEEALAGASGSRTIELRTRTAPGGVQLQVEDSGGGIPRAHLERIFDPFWTTKSPGEGAGLGLSMVHRIVTDQGGDVRVRSQAGEGAVFTVTLRSAVDDAAVQPDPLGPPERSLRILVVDDEAAVRGSIARYLVRRGHTVDEAENGKRALELVSRERGYDAVLTDLRMPAIDGERFLDCLARAAPGLELKTVVITGDPGRVKEMPILETADVPILLKPVRLEAVALALEGRAERSPLPGT